MARPVTLIRRLLNHRWQRDFTMDCCHRSNGTLRAGPPVARPNDWSKA